MSEDNKILAAVLASGNGTNAENIIKFTNHESSNIHVKALICDNPDADILNKTAELDVLSALVPFKGSIEAQEKAILDVLDALNIEWLFLAGYMRILSKDFINHYYDEKLGQSKILNIHPALLPEFRGLNAYKKAFDAGVDKSGVTVHFVDNGVDTGKIIIQESFDRLDSDDFESFKKRGMDLEYKSYREAIKLVMNGDLE